MTNDPLQPPIEINLLETFQQAQYSLAHENARSGNQYSSLAPDLGDNYN